MNSNIQIFENSVFGTLRVVMKNENPWFVAKDVSDILGYSDSHEMIKRLDPDEVDKINASVLQKGVIVESGKMGDSEKQGFSINKISIINESGLYNSVFGSKKPEAKTFTKWVTSEVLPSIRKNGGYLVAKKEETPEELMARAAIVAMATLERIEKERKALVNENHGLKKTIGQMQRICINFSSGKHFEATEILLERIA